MDHGCAAGRRTVGGDDSRLEIPRFGARPHWSARRVVGKPRVRDCDSSTLRFRKFRPCDGLRIINRIKIAFQARGQLLLPDGARVDQDSGTKGIPTNGVLLIFVHPWHWSCQANNGYRSDEVSEQISGSESQLVFTLRRLIHRDGNKSDRRVRNPLWSALVRCISTP